MLLLCASAWELGLAGACLRLGAVRYFVSRLFDKFCEVLFVVFCVFSPHLACHVPFISTVLSSRLLVRVVTLAVIHTSKRLCTSPRSSCFSIYCEITDFIFDCSILLLFLVLWIQLWHFGGAVVLTTILTLLVTSCHIACLKSGVFDCAWISQNV